ncbi:cysteine hydrolase family protein [Halomonas mongoliensis]|uniref:Cysteine hydrolase family protein n=1 Tax=Halomonas mongoliensis TaxID=321265 RepID=A0ABU1GLA1_9GAMM|nr:cysteine hydrolase family protein [Halomonas mongoliensis]MDR5892341.1 cysteine hydrolase family protein [Halomonas mongoliensis]
MSQTALMIVDLQNDYFPAGKWPLVGIEQAADNAAGVLAHFRERSLPIVHIRHEFPSEEAPFFVPGSEGARIHDAMAPQESGSEAVILKNSVNAFLDTSLHEHLQEQGIEQLVVVGAMSHMCIDAATRAASDLGYSVTVLQDACATHDQEFNGQTVPAAQVHAAFMAGLAFAYAEVIDTSAWLKRQG